MRLIWGAFMFPYFLADIVPQLLQQERDGKLGST
jgi:hypothetical protein